jgi:HTH-type transcriptional regulator / antitoxin HipB
MREVDQYSVRTAEQLPALLKAFRKQAGLTQGQLAARLGITQQTLSTLERNANKVSADRLLQLLGILGVEMVLQPRGEDASLRRQTTRGDAGW